MPAEIVRTRIVHEGWCRLLVATLRGEDGTEFNREIEDHGNAVGVLPYDPERRVALLARLLRTPVLFAAGEDALLEAPAGLVEDEDAADSARREALEEVGVRLGTLEHVVRAWSSPGISSESIDLFLAPYSAADRIEKGGGLDGENENITVVEMPLSELLAGARSGAVTDLKTLFLVLALKDRHPDLFGGA